jgi:hypothetical protein
VISVAKAAIRSPGSRIAPARIWAAKGRVVSVSRKHLVALDEVVSQMRAGAIRDPGDLIAAFATEITEDLDPSSSSSVRPRRLTKAASASLSARGRVSAAVSESTI